MCYGSFSQSLHNFVACFAHFLCRNIGNDNPNMITMILLPSMCQSRYTWMGIIETHCIGVEAQCQTCLIV